jgi:hypothetical protein
MSACADGHLDVLGSISPEYRAAVIGLETSGACHRRTFLFCVLLCHAAHRTRREQR